MKYCAACGIEHPLSAFQKRTASKTGLASSCRESRKKYHKKYPELPFGQKVPPRDGDRRQAQRRIQTLVLRGDLPHPSTLECVDCHRKDNGTKKGRLEYDHYKGYAPEHHEVVVARCVRCHKIAEAKRRRENLPPDPDPAF